MLPIIENRKEELGARFDVIQNEIIRTKYAALASKGYCRWIDEHAPEVKALKEEQDELYARLNEFVSLDGEIESDDKNVVRKYLERRLNFIREIDKNSTRPDQAKIRAARIDEVTKLLEAIDNV